jgi:diguanylate cyclase (GGDEF)-like protein/PAS domain S-box-containing protein
MSKRGLWIYGAWTATLTVLYVLLPEYGLPLLLAVMLTTTTAVAVGVRRNRPRRWLPWALIGGATFAFGTGSITAVVLSEVLHVTAFPSWADGIFLGVFMPMLFFGLFGLTRSGAAIRDRASMIDALILTAAAAFLSWVFLVNPYLVNPQLSALEKGISIAYPMYDVLILALFARIAIGTARSPSSTFLLISGTSLLAADVMYGLSQLNGDWQLGGPVDVGWLLFYAAAGAAALHPSMVELTEPKVLRHQQVAARRVVLGVASLAAPAVLFVQALRGPVHDGVVIAVGSALLVLLAIARMSVVASSLVRSLTRERELRLACEALLSTTDPAALRDVMHSAVARLLPPGTPHSVTLALDGTDGGAGGGTGGAHGTDSTDGLALAMRYTRTLPPDLATRLGDFELALHCPLSVGRRHVGDLFVGAEEIALVSLQDAVPVLAGQAASMVRTITLNREINRRDSEAYFRTLVLNAADVIVMIDSADRVTYASPSAGTVLGRSDLVGTDLLDLVDPDDRDRFAATVDAARAGGGASDATALGMRRGDGERAEIELSIRDLRHEPTVGQLVLTMRDVTERRRLERELLRRAYLDQLTGLGNRLRFQDAVEEAVAQAGETGLLAGVLVLDVDDFKVVNDSMGHAVGDQLLIEISRRLVDVLPERATVARLGADEFGVVFPGAMDTEQIEVAVEAVMTAFAAPFLVSHSVITVNTSVGVSTTEDAASTEQLLSQADLALGTAKGAGKGRWRRYEASLHQQVIKRMQIRTDLDQAIADGAFLLNYQPIVDLETGVTRGLEALVRWHHPVRGMIPPLEFIEVAEESGLIVPLGTWVMRNAIATAAHWMELRPEDPPYVSVNVSVRQFRTPDFVERVLDDLAQAGLPPRLLTVEITESLLLGDDEKVNADIDRLRLAGIKVSIDDFGTGYSSLSYLHRVQVDTLKLDKSFVDTISTSARQLDLVRGIIRLAQTLEIAVVAEGIETPTDRALLADARCGFGQGYLFARPMPGDAVDEWLSTDLSQAAPAR